MRGGCGVDAGKPRLSAERFSLSQTFLQLKICFFPSRLPVIGIRKHMEIVRKKLIVHIIALLVGIPRFWSTHVAR